MRAFLIAFICLSTLAMAQNVVVATPVVSTPSATPVSDAVADPDGASASVTVSARSRADRFVAASLSQGPSVSRAQGPSVSRATTMLLLVVGLSGLCAVGGRRHDRRERRPA